ncbi:Immunoglobulin-like domain [Trinorchestia longiramus]|nr:Immunoglobulin-like domain [Trinorchestia longiramus]
MQDAGPLTEQWAVIDGSVFLPCDVTAPQPDDSPILVLISKGDMPVYSVDARDSGRFATARKWSSPHAMGVRGRFSRTGGGGLEISPVRASDKSDYHCRVEFHNSPTRNSRIRLHLVVAPSTPVIEDEGGKVLSGVIGPYALEETITLACKVKGEQSNIASGYPLPRVTWWHERFLLDDISEITDGQLTVNKITLPNLSRQHLDRKLTCQASNSNLTKPILTSIVLNMSFPPASVDIQGGEGPLSEGERYTLVCQSTGSRPPASLLWFQDGVKLNQSNEVVLRGQTQSTLLLSASREVNGKVLVCRGTNPTLPHISKEDRRILDVHFPPSLQLSLGRNLNIEDINERDDVYFECHDSANPKVNSVVWYHNGTEVKTNRSSGIILSTRSLVLQSVARTASGSYTCGASNTQGTTLSNALTLNVHYAPVCATGQQLVYGSGRRDLVNITCDVEASPLPHSFSWSLNSSSTDLLDVPRSKVFNKELSSVLAYTPHTPLDYGSLLCWAENAVGKQKEPCVFQVVPAAVPEPVHNCSAWHNSSAAGQVVIKCWQGWNGGLEQSFSLRVHEGDDASVVASKENQESPRFTVTGLKPGKEYTLQVIASNSQGETKPVTLKHLTPIDIAEKRLSKTLTETAVGVSTAVGVFAGVGSVLLLCCIMTAVLFKVRASSNSRRFQSTQMDVSDAADDDGCFKSDGEPDVILTTASSKDCRDEHQLTQTSELSDEAQQTHLGVFSQRDVLMPISVEVRPDVRHSAFSSTKPPDSLRQKLMPGYVRQNQYSSNFSYGAESPVDGGRRFSPPTIKEHLRPEVPFYDLHQQTSHMYNTLPSSSDLHKSSHSRREESSYQPKNLGNNSSPSMQNLGPNNSVTEVNDVVKYDDVCMKVDDARITDESAMSQNVTPLPGEGARILGPTNKTKNMNDVSGSPRYPKSPVTSPQRESVV